ncbi:MAG: YfhO family protein, partial [Lachnospiraceae bacterium]|nr:YfhO family protein [Lachnospiraceae bacterium]
MNRKKRFLISAVSGACTFIVLAIVFRLLGLVPFTGRSEGLSLAYDDAYFQFIDFLGYFKDVLSGRQSIAYSFSNYLGQGSIAFFSYYLSTPFNLFMFFLKKHHILLFFDTEIVLKMCLSAFTFAWFLTGRFKERLPFVFTVSLSVGYSLMQYVLHQG